MPVNLAPQPFGTESWSALSTLSLTSSASLASGSGLSARCRLRVVGVNLKTPPKAKE